MPYITYITGGERSGKSRFAESMAESLSERPVYLATARHWDPDFSQRVAMHQASRGQHWETVEEEKELSRHTFRGRVVLLDCITLWINNFYHDSQYDATKALEEAKAEWNRFARGDFRLIVVSNELGMGVHAADASTRKFVEIHGWTNQHIASMAQEAYLMVSGIPVKIK
jgi:adenosylcobinamide kinase / adenosylcobinamide-phosphate guanylyltransferase